MPKQAILALLLVPGLLGGVKPCQGAENGVKTVSWYGIVVHISDSNHMTPQECDQWHRARGWDGCGYNVVIEPDGVLYEARGLDKVGAHAFGYNRSWLGVCFVSKDGATTEQLETFRAWRRQHGFEHLPVMAHNKVNPNKRCGATVMAQFEVEVISQGGTT